MENEFTTWINPEGITSRVAVQPLEQFGIDRPDGTSEGTTNLVKAVYEDGHQETRVQKNNNRHQLN